MAIPFRRTRYETYGNRSDQHIQRNRDLVRQLGREEGHRRERVGQLLGCVGRHDDGAGEERICGGSVNESNLANQGGKI